jgi:hypothetical protein
MFNDAFEEGDGFGSVDFSKIFIFDINKENLGEDSVKEDNIFLLKNSFQDSILNGINQFQGPLLNIIPEEKSTSPITKIQETVQNYKSNNKIKENNEESISLVPFYSFLRILNIFKINNIDFKIIDKFTKGKHIENSPEYRHVELGIFVKNNRKLNAGFKNYINKKRGRKITTNIINFIHDNMSPDNIIKKIKSKIFKLVLNFINNLLYLHFKERKLLKTDYSYVNKMNQKENLEYLDMSLRDILSFDISKKYKFKFKNQKDYNKKIIEQVEKLENTQTLTFALNLSLQDFMDIFCFIKKFEDFEKKENIDLAALKNSFTYCDSILKEIYDFSDDYFAFFIFFIYNYKRWFSIKKKRNIIKKEEDTKESLYINLNL